MRLVRLPFQVETFIEISDIQPIFLHHSPLIIAHVQYHLQTNRYNIDASGKRFDKKN